MFEVPPLCHLLDDFLLAKSRFEKWWLLKTLLHVFNLLSILLPNKNIIGPSVTLELLGITLDTVTLENHLSAEEIFKLKEPFKFFLGKRKCTMRTLLSFVGSLSFACKVVVLGRVFLSHLIQLCYSVHKLHHYVYLNKNIKKGFELWLTCTPMQGIFKVIRIFFGLSVKPIH